MAELKINADSGGGTVGLAGPASTTGNAAIQFKLPVADGSSGQYLKTDGSGNLSWATASGGGGGGGKLTLISSTTFTSATAAVTFTSISGYLQYKLIYVLNTSGAGVIYVRMGVDGTYDSTSNYRQAGGGQVDKIKINGAGFAGTSYTGESTISHLNQALTTKYYGIGTHESNDQTSANVYTNGAIHESTAAQNCLQIFGSSGNIPSGTISLYGIATS